MKIILEQTDLEEAIRNHVTDQGLSTSDKAMNIEFTNGRTETTATVELTKESSEDDSLGKAETAEAVSEPEPDPVQEDTPAENAESEGTDEPEDAEAEEEEAESPQALFS